jgi:hypothetical protein
VTVSRCRKERLVGKGEAEATPSPYPHVRSIAMNAWFNSTDAEGFGSGFRVYKKKRAI